MSKRLIWADIIRIFAIYCIIVLHVVQVPDTQQVNITFPIGLTLADTCVPLLVMLSGALLIDKQESYTTFFRKRVSRVVIPWITWSLIFTAIVLYFQTSFNLIAIAHTFHAIFIPFFWFIVLVCALYLLTPAIRTFAHTAQGKDILVIVILWFIAVSLLPNIRDTQAFPLHVDNGIVQLVINFIGYFFLGFLIKTKLQKKYLPFVIAIFIISLLGRSFLEYYSLHTHRQLINGSEFIDPSLVIVASSLFSLFYLFEDAYQRLFNPVIKAVIQTISQATLGIYFVHYLFLNRAPLPILLPSTSIIHISYITDMFLNAFIFFTLSLFIILFLQKIPGIKHLIT